MAGMQKQFVLEGLCCGNCAAAIERDVARLEGVSSAAVDFPLKTLTMEISDAVKADGLIAEAAAIVKRHEPDIDIREKERARPAENEPGGMKKRAGRIALYIGAALFIAGIAFDFGSPGEFLLFLASYILIGGSIVLRALKNISRGRIFDENLLMSVATVGAFAIGEYPEGAAVMLFYQIGEMFQRLAVGRSRKAISALMDIRPDFANLKTGDGLKKVSPEEVRAGDFIVVKPGERVPLDGIVSEGRSALDTSALTGESAPRDVSPGSGILSGSINKNGVLTVEVSKEFGESTVSRILDLVQNASAKKAPTENFITAFARYYTPVVVFSAAALAFIPPLVLPGAAFSDWIYRALAFLVVSCPCALVISIPLSFFGGIGGASRNGILVKGGNYLEALSRLDTVVFDKTGTLTKGVFKVTDTVAANGFSERQLLAFAAEAEGLSTHPIAISIRKAYGDGTDTRRLTEYEEIPGQGISVKVDGRRVLLGSGKLMASSGIAYQPAEALGSVVYLAVDGVYAGHIVISDELKPDSREAVRGLKALGVKNTVMLTGDGRAVGEAIARELGLDAVYAELLPHQKVERLEELEMLKKSKGRLAFAGDGINDAPVLARADVGIAMGALGSDAAIEAADVVLMTDEPLKIVTAVRIARRTKAIVWQNILFAMGVKVILLALSAFGVATMWEAVFGDVGVTLIATLNAMRAMRVVGNPAL